MSITRINEFKAKAEKSKELHEFLASLLPVIQSFKGCIACELFLNHAWPEKFLFIETWENIEAHQNSAKNIPPEQIKKVMLLLAEPPKGQYYEKK